MGIINKRITVKLGGTCAKAREAQEKLEELKIWARTGFYLIELPELDEYGSEESDLSLLQYCYYRFIYDVADNIIDKLYWYPDECRYETDMSELVKKVLSLSLIRRVSKRNVMLLFNSFITDTKLNEYCFGTNWNIEKVADTILPNNGGTKDLLKEVIKYYNTFVSDDEIQIETLILKGEIKIEAFCNVSDHNVLAVNFPYNFLSNNKFPDVSALIYIERIDATYRAYLNVCRWLPFVWDVIGSLINKTLPLICEAKRDYILNLLYTIPIYLRKKRPETWNIEKDIVEPFGAYFPNTKEKSPYIELYVDTISEFASGKEFKWLFTKVLIHELAHAALDINNSEYLSSVTPKVLYNTDFGRWREESMANAVALRVIRDYGDLRFYVYSENFMLHQPAEYALGVEMVDWDYTDFCSVIDGKRYGVGDILQQEWLDYAQGNPTWEGLHRWNGRLSK